MINIVKQYLTKYDALRLGEAWKGEFNSYDINVFQNFAALRKSQKTSAHRFFGGLIVYITRNCSKLLKYIQGKWHISLMIFQSEFTVLKMSLCSNSKPNFPYDVCHVQR